MIKFENVTKTYEDGFIALNNISLEVNQGELLVLIGPSGCGKTTTMKMINRLIDSTSGNIRINDKSIKEQDPVTLRRDIGYVIQQIGLFPHMTIAENVALVPRLKKEDPKQYMAKVYELLEMVGLAPDIYKDRYPRELSGGQQQRVGVIRALASDPSIILMDEPFSALDPISREQLQEELVRLQDDIKKTIVFVTHDMDEALKIADRICIMKDGEIVQIDTPERILRHPKNEFVRSFIGEDRLQQAKQRIFPALGDLISRAVTVKPTRGLAEAAKILQKNRVDSLILVDKEDRYLGIASAWDIYKNYEDESMTVSDVMKTDHTTIDIEQNMEEAIVDLNQARLGYLPVLDGSGKIKGVLTNAIVVELFSDGITA